MDFTNIEKEVEAQDDMIWDLASKVWDFAEVGYKELKSSAYSSGVLEKNGFSIENRGVGGLDTSWVATWGTSSPRVGILVEFDALPDLGNHTVPSKCPAKNGNSNGHGCGHNLICSTAIGAAVALKNCMENEEIAGTVKVYGCPAEEMLNGKNYMAKHGIFDDLDFCLHSHPGPVNTVWNFHSAASIDLWVEWFGTTAHAGATPWQGRSALQAAEIFLVSANMMREHMLPTARLHYQIIDGGSAVNVVPGYSKILVRYRGPSAANILEYKSWIEDIAKGAALATQTKTKVTNLGGIQDCLPNDNFAALMNSHVERYLPCDFTDEEHSFAKDIQKEFQKPENGMATSVLPIPTGVEVGGSSDVGDVSWKVPTMGAVIAAWPLGLGPHNWGCTACHGMSIGRKATQAGARVLAATAYELLMCPEKLAEVKSEFKKRTDAINFTSLCDEENSPLGKLEPDVRHQFECVVHTAMEYLGIEDHSHIRQ